MIGCKEPAPAIEQCPIEGTTGEACEEPDDEVEIAECASPAFAGTHPAATAYSCEGLAGGAIVFSSVLIKKPNGDVLGGGQGSAPNPANVFDFPGDFDVGACCHSNPSQAEVGEACARDCGRAACNRVLADLRGLVQSSDPSNGNCDEVTEGLARNLCQERVGTTMQSWIAELEHSDKFEQCVVAARNNTNIALGYDDPAEPFAEEKKVQFSDPPCNADFAGCLVDAELRPFCRVDDQTAGASCNAALNPIDENVDSAVDEGSDDGADGSGEDPFGNIDELVDCTLVTAGETECLISAELIDNVAQNFHVFWDEGVTGQFSSSPSGLKITGLDPGEESKALTDAFGSLNHGAIKSVNTVNLTSWGKIEEVLATLGTTSSWTVTVEHCRTSCTTHTYEISIEATDLTDPPGPPTDKAPTAGAPGETAGDSVETCACTTGARPRWPAIAGLGTLVLLGGLRRRRRSFAAAVRRPRRAGTEA